MIICCWYDPLFPDRNQKMQISSFSSIVGELTTMMRPMRHKAEFLVDELAVTMIWQDSSFLIVFAS